LVRSKCRNVDTVMASTAALQFGQLLYTSLIETGAVGPAVQAIVSPLSVWFALLLLLNGAGDTQSPGKKGQDSNTVQQRNSTYLCSLATRNQADLCPICIA